MPLTSGSAALAPHRHESDVRAHFRSSRRQFETSGIAAPLPAGPLPTLGQRARAFFAAHPDGPDLLLGCLPFDPARDDYLVQPREIVTPPATLPRKPEQAGAPQWQVRSNPDAAGYGAMVARALEAIAGAYAGPGGLRKVVLARRLLLQADRPVDAATIATRLGGDRSVTTFAMPLPPFVGLPRILVGGTPELLLAKQGRTIRSHPLAGSARRHTDPRLDEAAAASLLASDKNRREHAAAVEAVLDALAPFCSSLSVPDGPGLQSTASMWHLGTLVEGQLRDADLSCADLLAPLHPTPAVCGFPRAAAQKLIAELEPFERGFYAGAVGWMDRAGDGEWHIALRCGEIAGRQITLYAGAGIVLGSDPAAEAAETSAKFVALLQALDIDENGRPLGGASR